jgi:hypothetical protein
MGGCVAYMREGMAEEAASNSWQRVFRQEAVI